MATTGNTGSSETTSGTVVWIGIDWGTSNCAVAVYDRIRGGCKWLRLPEIGGEVNNKVGRLVPTILVVATHDFVHGTSNDHSNDVWRKTIAWHDVSDILGSTSDQKQDSHTKLWACFGAVAHKLATATSTQDVNINFNVNAATIQSSKRLILQQVSDDGRGVGTHGDSGGDRVSHRNRNRNHATSTSTPSTSTATITLKVTPLGSTNEITLDAVDVLAVMLRLLHQAAVQALQRNARQSRKPVWDIPVTSSSGARCHMTWKDMARHTTTMHVAACVGVPAAAPYAYRQLLHQAAVRAGLDTATMTLTESTAAAMAYGLWSNTNVTQSNVDARNENDQGMTVVVFDMGGGTTDVTIAEKSKTTRALSASDVDTSAAATAGYHVCVTVGHDRLGGDDMDEALLTLVWRKVQVEYPHLQLTDIDTDGKNQQTAQLLHQCRLAKLSLCGDGGNPSDSKPVASVKVTIPVAWLKPSTSGTSSNTLTVSVTLTQDDWQVALTPILEQTRLLIQRALLQYEKYRDRNKDPRNNTDNASESRPVLDDMPKQRYPFDEVILIGGASRVPSLRRLIVDLALTRQELCTSVSADSAVAQGCATSAAVSSGAVPLHEIQSALMLDTIPHPIGVLCLSSTSRLSSASSTLVAINEDVARFVEILPLYATLPANGYATFQLADARQAGVTLNAVERIEEGHYVNMGEFSFLLHRLSKDQIASLPNGGIRSIDIGMTLRPNGEFVVSIFDANDPDHIRKRERMQHASGGAHVSDTNESQVHAPKVDDPVPMEQISLIGASLVLFLLYVVAKLCFQDISALQTASSGSSVAPM